MNKPNVKDAYRHCLAISRSHYENFPVASYLIPAALRGPIAVIYAFSRTADDFADEGDLDPATRLTKLDEYVTQLDRIKAGDTSDDPVFIGITAICQQYHLPLQLFYDLLTAFRMDVTKNRYANFSELLHYSRYSANPVGRLMLHLFDAATEINLQRSDAICSALQLINFWQDVIQDFDENNRIYLPQDDMKNLGIDESWLKERRSDDAMRNLFKLLITKTSELMTAGAPLAWTLKGRFGLELRLTVLGGSRILQHLSQQRKNVFSRPRLSKQDKLWMLWHGLTSRQYRQALG